MVNLVRLARQRLFYNGLLAEGVLASSAAVAAFIVLLLLGTEILDWRWLLGVPLAAAVAGIYRARKRLPAHYAVAQLVDTRMELADALATAYYFHDPSRFQGSEDVRLAQLARAETMAAAVDVRRAMPYRIPRSAYALAGLCLAASALFALRYGLSRRLDLRPPLAFLVAQEFGGQLPPGKSPDPRRRPLDRAEQEPASEASADQPEDPGAQDASPSDETKTPQTESDASKQAHPPRADARAADTTQPKDGSRQGPQPADNQGRSESANASQQGDRQGNQAQRPDTGQDTGSGENSSLFAKVKDAFENLLSRMKPQSGAPGSEEQPARASNASPEKGQSPSRQAGQKGQKSDSGAESDADQAEEKAQNAPDSAGPGRGKTDSAETSKQPGSGIGSQNGDKSIRQAEQLAAMGKISEILGKRAANITGEATLEVDSTNQQLRTQYARRDAQHAQTGSQIARDEIPVALEAYVEQYFEQVRKPTVAKKQPVH